jgi:hypothetical protein
MRWMTRGLLASLLVFLLCAAPAAAHGIVERKGSTISYLATDDPTQNTLVVELTRSKRCHAKRCVLLTDTTVQPGMEATGGCVEGPKDAQGNVHAVYCPRTANTRFVIDLGDLDDTARVDAPYPAGIRGGPGNDRLTGSAADDRILGGPGDDSLFGRSGDDELFGDVGADKLDAGAGEDHISAVDGVGDKTRCGPGTDSAAGDTSDTIGDCENFTRVITPDATPPPLKLTIKHKQHVNHGGIHFSVTTTPSQQFTVSGTLTVGRSHYKLRTLHITTGGAKSGVDIGLPASALAKIRRGARGIAHITANTADPNRNETGVTSPAITLTR